jgi:hypothetical protein
LFAVDAEAEAEEDVVVILFVPDDVLFFPIIYDSVVVEENLMFG